MKPSEQQKHYASLAPAMAAPFNEFPWEYSGFVAWYRRMVHDDPRFVPDGHYVDVENGRVYILEIVNTCDITEEKAEKFSAACWALDEIDWEVDIVLFFVRQGSTSVNQYGLFLEGKALQMSDRTSPYRDAFSDLVRPANHPDLSIPTTI